MGEPSRILVVDDDEAVGKGLVRLLVQDGYAAVWQASAEAALSCIDVTAFDAVLTDVRMPGKDGFALLRALKLKLPEVPVALITAHASVELAVEAMREGAADFLSKPVGREPLLAIVRRVLEASAPIRKAPPPPLRLDANGADGIIGSSPALEDARVRIGRAAAGVATVLLRGETGTGKELAARAIHRLSPRAKKPFICLNCAALPENLFESEMFGYEKGAFTGALARKPGRVDLAEGGTLFLDEVGELPSTVQGKLLRLLQEKEFERLGGTQVHRADVRVVAATHRDLEKMVVEKTFREDLLYRLKVVSVELPPLRAHPTDIAALVAHFIGALGAANGRPAASIAPDAVELLAAQPWPGNVRQLQNFLEGLVVLSPEDRLTAADVKRELERGGSIVAEPVSSARGELLDDRRRSADRRAVTEALAKSKGNRTQAARLLGISRRTLYNLLEAMGPLVP